MGKIIIFDETNGLSRRGAFMKRLSKNRNIKYVSTIKEFLEEVKNDTSGSR